MDYTEFEAHCQTELPTFQQARQIYVDNFSRFMVEYERELAEVRSLSWIDERKWKVCNQISERKCAVINQALAILRALHKHADNPIPFYGE